MNEWMNVNEFWLEGQGELQVLLRWASVFRDSSSDASCTSETSEHRWNGSRLVERVPSSGRKWNWPVKKLQLSWLESCSKLEGLSSWDDQLVLSFRLHVVWKRRISRVWTIWSGTTKRRTRVSPYTCDILSKGRRPCWSNRGIHLSLCVKKSMTMRVSPIWSTSQLMSSIIFDSSVFSRCSQLFWLCESLTFLLWHTLRAEKTLLWTEKERQIDGLTRFRIMTNAELNFFHFFPLFWPHLRRGSWLFVEINAQHFSPLSCCTKMKPKSREYERCHLALVTTVEPAGTRFKLQHQDLQSISN